ncbi:hypothetical protein Q7P35_008988 [Cladosporium inversicolor]
MSDIRLPPKTIVRFPSLVVGFLIDKPTKVSKSLNSDYVTAKVESEQTIKESGLFSTRQLQAIVNCDFSYFASVMVPHAEAEDLRIICNWGNWIFPFDDLFDNGDVRKDTIQAQNVMQHLEQTFCEGDAGAADQALFGEVGSSKSLFELTEMHRGIYKSIAKRCSPGTRRRYVASMRQYSSGTLSQVRQVESTRMATFVEVLAQRRQSVCVTPLFVLVEFGHKIDLPDEAFENAHVHRLEMLGVEIVLLHNDLLSYCKEEEEGVVHNTVAVCRLQGMGAQEAVTFIGTEVSCRMAEFEEAVQKLEGSSWEYANELLRYVQGIRDVIKANLWWSLRTERFLSKEQKSRLFAQGTLEVASVIPCCG